MRAGRIVDVVVVDSIQFKQARRGATGSVAPRLCTPIIVYGEYGHVWSVRVWMDTRMGVAEVMFRRGRRVIAGLSLSKAKARPSIATDA